MPAASSQRPLQERGDAVAVRLHGLALQEARELLADKAPELAEAARAGRADRAGRAMTTDRRAAAVVVRTMEDPTAGGRIGSPRRRQGAPKAQPKAPWVK